MIKELLEKVDRVGVMIGGFQLAEDLYLLNSNGEDSLYSVLVKYNSYFGAYFVVDARYEQDAIDKVAEFCVDNELTGMYQTYEDIVDNLTDEDVVTFGVNDAVDSYIEDNRLIYDSDYRIFMEIVDMKQL